MQRQAQGRAIPPASGKALSVAGQAALRHCHEGWLTLGLAGLWENWKHPHTGEWERTFAIILIGFGPAPPKVSPRDCACTPNYLDSGTHLPVVLSY
jgi:hypothetical protein